MENNLQSDPDLVRSLINNRTTLLTGQDNLARALTLRCVLYETIETGIFSEAIVSVIGSEVPKILAYGHDSEAKALPRAFFHQAGSDGPVLFKQALARRGNPSSEKVLIFSRTGVTLWYKTLRHDGIQTPFTPDHKLLVIDLGETNFLAEVHKTRNVFQNLIDDWRNAGGHVLISYAGQKLDPHWLSG